MYVANRSVTTQNYNEIQLTHIYPIEGRAYSDVNKDWTCKDKDKDQAHKDQDKDKDWTFKDKDKDFIFYNVQGLARTSLFTVTL